MVAFVKNGRVAGFSVATLPRPTDAQMTNRTSLDVLYVRSYLALRSVIGVVGIVVPIVLMISEGFFTTRGLRPQSSVSAYYHTSAGQDIFVAGLFFLGIMLTLYMSGQPRTIDFAVSTVAGLALIGVVFFPTNRDLSGLKDTTLCGPHATPEPVSCSPTESRWGEHRAIVARGVRDRISCQLSRH